MPLSRGIFALNFLVLSYLDNKGNYLRAKKGTIKCFKPLCPNGLERKKLAIPCILF